MLPQYIFGFHFHYFQYQYRHEHCSLYTVHWAEAAKPKITYTILHPISISKYFKYHPIQQLDKHIYLCLQLLLGWANRLLYNALWRVAVPDQRSDFSSLSLSLTLSLSLQLSLSDKQCSEASHDHDNHGAE